MQPSEDAGNGCRGPRYAVISGRAAGAPAPGEACCLLVPVSRLSRRGGGLRSCSSVDDSRSLFKDRRRTEHRQATSEAALSREHRQQKVTPWATRVLCVSDGAYLPTELGLGQAVEGVHKLVTVPRNQESSYYAVPWGRRTAKYDLSWGPCKARARSNINHPRGLGPGLCVMRKRKKAQPKHSTDTILALDAPSCRTLVVTQQDLYQQTISSSFARSSSPVYFFRMPIEAARLSSCLPGPSQLRCHRFLSLSSRECSELPSLSHFLVLVLVCCVMNTFQALPRFASCSCNDCSLMSFLPVAQLLTHKRESRT